MFVKTWVSSFQKPDPFWASLSSRTTHFTCSLLNKTEPPAATIFHKIHLKNGFIAVYCWALFQLWQFSVSIHIILYRTCECRICKTLQSSAGEEKIGSKILCSRLMLWNIAEKKNVKRGLVGRWGSCDDLTLLMGEGQIFRLIISVVCPCYYWSWSCLLSAKPWKGRGSDSFRTVFFSFFSLFLSSLSLLSFPLFLIPSLPI